MTAAGARYGRFLGLIALVTIGLVVVGWLPTRRLMGADGLSALVAGCAASLAASAAGALVVLRKVVNGTAVVTAAMTAMGLRVLVLVPLAAVLITAGWVEPKPFLLWLAISYMVLLVADTRLMQGLTEQR